MRFALCQLVLARSSSESEVLIGVDAFFGNVDGARRFKRDGITNFSPHIDDTLRHEGYRYLLGRCRPSLETESLNCS